jgi:hypothetical protein
MAVADFQWLAYRQYMLTDDGDYLGQRGEAMASAVTWVWGAYTCGPVTGRIDQLLNRAVAVAELWAAMAIYDGGGTTEWQLRAVCADLGVRYWRPEFERFTMDHGQGFYEALSWLIGYADGYERGHRCPLELPVRADDGTVATDPHSAELFAQIEETRRRAAADLDARTL